MLTCRVTSVIKKITSVTPLFNNYYRKNAQ